MGEGSETGKNEEGRIGIMNNMQWLEILSEKQLTELIKTIRAAQPGYKFKSRRSIMLEILKGKFKESWLLFAFYFNAKLE